MDEVIDKLVLATWKARRSSGYAAEIQRTVDQVVLYNLFTLASMESANVQAREIAALRISDLKSWIVDESKKVKDAGQRAHLLFALTEIERFQKNPKEVSIPHPLEAPPGQPIGDWGFGVDSEEE